MTQKIQACVCVRGRPFDGGRLEERWQDLHYHAICIMEKGHWKH